jgi:Domain of unknown function (DUF4440)
MRCVSVIAILTHTIVSLAMGQTVGNATYQNDGAKQQIIKIEREWDESRSNGDATFSETLLADDYIGITPTGMVQTKAEFIAEVKFGNHRGMTADYTETGIRIKLRSRWLMFYYFPNFITSIGTSVTGPINPESLGSQRDALNRPSAPLFSDFRAGKLIL